MNSRTRGWTGFLKDEGSGFLEWIESNGVLSKKFDSLAKALWSSIQWQVRTGQDAADVWEAVPAVVHCLDKPATYEKPGTARAYAWLYLLERYVRTWIALEKLVAAYCLPMARYGVRALDVGTGPGPSAFAVNDFYSAMTVFSELTANAKWRQPARISCVENDRNTNHLRHLLTEIIYEQSLKEAKSIFAMAGSLGNFKKILPTRDRKKRLLALRHEEEEYYDAEAGWWTSDLVYQLDEANDIAQSLHRYRFFVFNNFLTPVNTVARYRQNLEDILHDAHPGSVVVVIGGKGEKYCRVYECVGQLAESAGFERKTLKDDIVSSAKSVVSDRVYEEGQRIYNYLQELAPNEDQNIQAAHSHFQGSDILTSYSKLQVYRKYSWQRPRAEEQ